MFSVKSTVLFLLSIIGKIKPKLNGFYGKKDQKLCFMKKYLFLNTSDDKYAQKNNSLNQHLIKRILYDKTWSIWFDEKLF